MFNPFLDCHKVTEKCPVEDTIYEYTPSLGANAFFLAFFALALGLNLIFGVYFKTWTYLIAMGLATLVEALGYIGRILLHENPFDLGAFDLQIICLTFAPAFNSAALYLTLKHLIICFGEDQSRLKPQYYTWIFICSDVVSLILQGAGAGISATASTDPGLRSAGDAIVITGICFQVFTLITFGSLSTDYALRCRRYGNQDRIASMTSKSHTKFKAFLGSLVGAYLAILIRCVYRIAEQAGGFRNHIMTDQIPFIVFDGCMIVTASLLQTIFHPGYCFPRMGNRKVGKM